MLNIEKISYQQQNKEILDDINLNVDSGEIISLLGPSGSGKTTLLRVIMGLTTPSKGNVSMDAIPLTRDGTIIVPPEKRSIAFLFQDFVLFPHLSVEKNITIGIGHLSKNIRRERVDHLVDLLKIGHLLKRDIHTLSGGEQQRVALARTLVLKPKMLLLDEPFSNLDKMTKNHLRHDVKKIMREEGISALLATHDQEEAFFFSDKMVVLSKGRKVAEGSPRELYENPSDLWLARFTGETQVFEEPEIVDLFRDIPGEKIALGSWLVRPEDIELIDGSNFKISNIEFYGFHTQFFFDIPGKDEPLTAISLGPQKWKIGDTVDLTLRKRPILLVGNKSLLK